MASVSGSGGDCACAMSSLLLVGALVTGSSGSHVVSVGVILPFDAYEMWSLRLAGPAIEFAVTSVQRRSRAASRQMTSAVTLSNNYALRIHVNDSRCSDTWGPLSAFDMYLSGRANVFLGPVCEYAVAAVARYSPHWDIPVITPGALVLDFDNRANYRLLTRIAGSYSKLAESLTVLLRRFRWRPATVGLVYQQRSTKRRRTSRKTVGNSDCFFVMQAVHSHLEALRRPSSAAVSNASAGVWYRSIKHDALNGEEKLREMAQHVRSKLIPTHACDQTSNCLINAVCVRA